MNPSPQGLDAGASHRPKAPSCLWGSFEQVMTASMPAHSVEQEVPTSCMTGCLLLVSL